MLKQICKLEGLTRRGNVTEDQLYDIIVNEFGTSLHTVDYRQMTENVCIKYNTNISKDDFRKAVKIVNLEGVEERKRNSIKRRLYWAKGPADIYHQGAGFDKLSEMFDTFNLMNLIKSETCYTKNHKSLIDLLFTNKPLSFQKAHVTETGLSDYHKLISTFFKSRFSKAKPKVIKYRNYK